MRLIAKFLGLLGQTYTLAVIYFLAALAVSAHLSGPHVVLGTEVFRTALSEGSTTQTVARLVACAGTFLYFLAVGKYLAPLVLRWLGTDRGLLLTAFAIAALFLIVTVPGIVLAGLAGFFGGALFVDALNPFLWPSPYWVVLIPIAGMVSGLRKPLPPNTPEAPPEVNDAFDALATGLSGIAARVETALSSSMDIMSGGLVKVTFTYLGLNAMANAAGAESPHSQALIFWLPLAFALRDMFVLYMIRAIYPTLDTRTASGAFLVAYLLAVFLLSLLVLVVTVSAANLIMNATSLDLSLYGRALLVAPFGAGLGTTIVMLIIPAGLMALAFFHRSEDAERG